MKQLPNSLSMRRQRGVSLFTVLILMLLALTAVMGAFRVASLNETLLGNTADYARARAAAEAMVRDAEIDIRGRLPPYSTVASDGRLGTPCKPSASDATKDAAGYIGCRNAAAANTAFIPRNGEDYFNVFDIASANNGTYRCAAGICTPTTTTALANIEGNLAALTPLAATYRQFTGGSLATTVRDSNPILTGSGNNARAWYWIEVFIYDKDPYTSGTPPAFRIQPEPGRPIFRITAVAQGLKAGTQVVIRSVFVPRPINPAGNS